MKYGKRFSGSIETLPIVTATAAKKRPRSWARDGKAFQRFRELQEKIKKHPKSEYWLIHNHPKAK